MSLSINSVHLSPIKSREKLIGTDFFDYFTDPEKARVGYEEIFAKGLVKAKNYEPENKVIRK